jgi:hypothetical protein
MFSVLYDERRGIIILRHFPAECLVAKYYSLRFQAINEMLIFCIAVVILHELRLLSLVCKIIYGTVVIILSAFYNIKIAFSADCLGM